MHSAITDVLQTLLNGKDAVLDLSKYRDPVFEIISYLLHYPDPVQKREKAFRGFTFFVYQIFKTISYLLHYFDLVQKNKDSKTISDPHLRAINSVRGKAFETFILFVNQDEKKFDKTDKVKISSDSKKLYEEILQNEDTRALMFMFGRYILFFYHRDAEWLLGLLPQIFPSGIKEKTSLYCSMGWLS